MAGPCPEVSGRHPPRNGTSRAAAGSNHFDPPDRSALSRQESRGGDISGKKYEHPGTVPHRVPFGRECETKGRNL